MARGGPKWDDEFCAEHDGSIAGFEKLNRKIDDISDFGDIFERETINAQKVATIAAITVGSALVIGPLAFAAAPAIGGTIGVLSGLSGAAATSTGLAAIGGGSLAAGGLGMAGGIAIVSATGAALGGVLGGVVSNSYFREIDGFDIEHIKPGKGPKIIFIDGFLTQNKPEPTDWQDALKKIYPNNPWYYLRWESKLLLDIGKSLSDSIGKATATKNAAEMASKATKLASQKINPFGAILTLIGLANNPWSVGLVKAGQTGILLADLIARTDDEYILCGHSLGARVILYALQSLSTKNRQQIQYVHLIGGAIGNNRKDWDQASKAVKFIIHNYYSTNDWVLKTLYKAGTFFTSTPIGEAPIVTDNLFIKNHDVSKFVAGHTKYKNHFHDYCER